MPIFTADEISKILQRRVLWDVNGICIDSRQAKFGDIFIAINGERCDGNDFAQDAIKKGAVIAIVNKDISNCDRCIKVADPLSILEALAKYNVQRCCMTKYVAVTGSVGKTTTRNLVYHLLTECSGQTVYSTKNNFNSRIGLPICVAEMEPHTGLAVFEMGMSNFGDISHLTDIIAPDVSIITKICETHLQNFSCIWDIAKAKAEILDRTKSIAIVPGNSPFTEFFKTQAKCDILTFGYGDAAIVSCHLTDDGYQVQAKILDVNVDFVSHIPNLENCLAAILAAHAITNIPITQLATCIESFRPVNGRGQEFFIKDRNITIIDDAYNACPTSLKAAIKSLSNHKGIRKILAVGDMLELGPKEKYMHENISPAIDKYGIDLVFACGNLSKYLYENLRNEKKGAWAENSQQLAAILKEQVHNGDCVLIKGSHSMNMHFIVDYLCKDYHVL